jgi:hypothetical protein
MKQSYMIPSFCNSKLETNLCFNDDDEYVTRLLLHFYHNPTDQWLVYARYAKNIQFDSSIVTPTHGKKPG